MTASQDAAKAGAIARSGRSVTFTGDSRRLRQIAALLADQPDITVFLGDTDDGGVALVVEPAGDDAGCLVSDRV